MTFERDTAHCYVMLNLFQHLTASPCFLLRGQILKQVQDDEEKAVRGVRNRKNHGFNAVRGVGNRQKADFDENDRRRSRKKTFLMKTQNTLTHQT